MILDPILDVFRGKAVTIPPMDGAFRPNTELDEAPALLEIAAPDNLAFDGEEVVFSSDGDLLALSGGVSVPIVNGDSPITAVTAGRDGALAIARNDGSIAVRGGAYHGRILQPATFGGVACPTALAFDGADALLVAQGSARHPASDWAVDLMEKNAAGSLWRVDLAAARAQCLARDLAFAYGILVQPQRFIVSESWRHRLVAIARDGGAPQPLLTKLPGYPARLSPASDGGAWLALFAPRNRLIEFILLEHEYRSAMMRQIERPYWIAPALCSGDTFLEPLQAGGVKTMGIHKPWSPTRSYGLVVKLDAELRPVASLHSRANGRRHGITSVIEANGRVLAASKGGDAILEIDRLAGSDA
jgi:sugar lactone lactonase YvrE